jgi:hypothetical protein
MFLAQHDQLGLASQTSSQGGGLTADLTGALSAAGKPQIDLAIELVLQEVFNGLGLGTVTVAVPSTVANTTGGSLAFHRHHVPFAGIRAVFVQFGDKHDSQYSNAYRIAWISPKIPHNSREIEQVAKS